MNSRGNEPLAINHGPSRGRGTGEVSGSIVIPGAESPWLLTLAPFRGQPRCRLDARNRMLFLTHPLPLIDRSRRHWHVQLVMPGQG